MESNSNSAPPVNNALLPDIYNKLDADLQERTRVINTQLDKRLSMQERVLNKYRRAAERLYKEESIRVRQDLVKINKKLPAVGNIRNFCLGYISRKKKHGRKRKGIPEEKIDMPFCERHFIHHLPTKKKFYKQPTPTPPPPGDVEGGANVVPGDAAVVNGVVPAGESVTDTDGVGTDVSLGVMSDVQLNPVEPRRVLPASR
ncbi:uncharacterized protein LOC124134823 [Haliotis rufescens]|uniref:uncharacterized protein LOC124134823 n=1 Tax=Haliotis rufescens TaxID=6454 RepID=UPI001EAFE28C|nr:uncharacterized protein LOC124134823 [Haliotis rufescens]